MAKRVTGPRVVTGNRLSDGLVVFLSPHGEWRPGIENAAVAGDDAGAAALEEAAAAAVRTNVIVDAYLVEISEEAGTRTPVELRERMRIGGPTVSTALNSGAHGRAAATGSVN